MTSESQSELGTYLKSLRDAKGVTLREVEEKIGVSNAFLSQVESGKVKQPSPVVLYKLAELYGVPYDVLMARAGFPVADQGFAAHRSAGTIFNRLGKITEDEEQSLLDYLSFIRSRVKRGGQKK